jgi:hypothetical protein
MAILTKATEYKIELTRVGDIVLSEARQTQKDQHCMSPGINCQIHRDKKENGGDQG